MLYSIMEIDDYNQAGIHTIPAGNLAAMNLVIPQNKGLLITLAQESNTQDFSMRIWLSTEANGNNLFPDYQNPWNLIKVKETTLIYDQNMQPSKAMRLIPIEFGTYVLNILNLINSSNSFSFSSCIVDL